MQVLSVYKIEANHGVQYGFTAYAGAWVCGFNLSVLKWVDVEDPKREREVAERESCRPEWAEMPPPIFPSSAWFLEL